MSGRKPTRLNREIRYHVARQAAEQAKKLAMEKASPAIEAFRDAVVAAWIGDEEARTAYANAPVHFFAAKRVEFTLRGASGSEKRLQMDLPPLPARPAFDLSVETDNWMLRVDVPDRLIKPFLDAYHANQEAWQKGGVVLNTVRNNLDAYTLVKQARTAVPELSPFLPPDYQEDADITAAAALRDTLTASGLTEEVSA